jgi:hypothetical protein
LASLSGPSLLPAWTLDGVFRPLDPVSASVQNQQSVTLTIEGASPSTNWLADATPQVTIEEVRRALSKIATSGADLVNAEREDR